MKTNLILILIVSLAALTRLPFLDQIPNGFTGDEAQQGYSAYSILKTGKDEWGQVLPIFPRGFGDYKPPVYTYLTVPSVAVFDLSIFGVRFPAAILGILTVLATYFLTKELTKSKEIGILAAFLLSISPWHIQISRSAWEGGAGILFFTLGLLYYLKSQSKIKYLILASIFWGLTLYSYHSFRVFAVIFVIGLFFLIRKKLKISKNITIAALILLLFLLPLLLNIKTTLARSSDVGITSSQQIEGFFKDKGVSPLPSMVDKVFDNKFLFIKGNLVENYLSYYSPTFLFTGARSDGTYLNFPRFELVYLIEIVFWAFAGWALIFKKVENREIILLWFFIAAIPASLATGAFNANRAPTFLPLVSMISAIGAKFFIDWLKLRTSLSRKNIVAVLVVVLFLSFSYFIYFYTIKLPQKPPNNLRYGYEDVFNEILKVQSQYDEVIISKSFTEPQIFIAFYGKMDPTTFQEASKDWLRYEKAGKAYLDQMESWNLGKYRFEGLSWNLKDKDRKNALVVGESKDFPEDIGTVFEVRNPKGLVIYKLVPTKSEIDEI